MKKIYILLFFIPWFNFSQSICQKTIIIGEKTICLPIIAGMTESYSSPTIKSISDTFKGTEDEIIYAVYMANDNVDYDKIMNNGLGYPLYKLYGNKNIVNLEIPQNILGDFFQQMKSYLGEDMTSLTKKINGRFDEIALDQLSIETPALIDSFSINNNSMAYTLIMEFTIENNKMTVVSNITVTRILKKLLFFANYNIYNGLDSIKKTNKETIFFIKELYKLN